MDINDISNRIRYTATASQTVFTIPFEFFAVADIKVYRNGTLLSYSAAPTTVSQFSMTGAGVEGGGSITLGAGATLNDDILIIRDIPIERQGDFPVSGPFSVASLNTQLDKLTAMSRDLEERAARSLRLSQTDQPESLNAIPAKDSRKNLYLGFDANGQPLAAQPNEAEITNLTTRVGALEVVSGNGANVSTVAANIADVNTTAANIANINIVADNIADVNNFADVYQGGKASDPTLRNDGSALQTGDLYYNTVNNRMRIYETGTGWIDYEATAQAAATTATTQAGIATSQATAATTQATTATTQAGIATSAKVAAELARDAAFVNAAVYVSTAAGLAATTNGQQFMVPAGTSIIRYRNDTGVATPIAYYPAKAALDPLQRTNLSIFAVEDGDGNLGLDVQTAFRVNKNGGVETTKLFQVSEPRKWLHALSDLDGNILFGINESGQLVADFSLVPSSQAAIKTGGTYDYEVNHVFNYGQSLSVGQSTPAISTTQKYDNLMFVRGMRPQYDYLGETAAQWYASAIPAVESQSPTQAILAETPSMGTGDSIKERILVEDGLAYNSMSYQLMLSAPGYGATTIAQLSKGTTHYDRMVEQAQYGFALANAANKTYAVQAVTWTQGESDYIGSTAQSAYVAAVNTLVADFNTDLKAATGQTKSIPLISYQIASHKVYSRSTPNIALAQLEVEASNPLVYIATPMYHFDYAGAADAHLTSISSRWLGAYYGLAYKRVVIDGEDWKPLKPVSSTKQGKTVVVRFHVPKGRLYLDTTLVVLNTNYGFELVDSGGTALTISSVSILGPDTLKVVAAANIPTGAKLRYAWSGAGTVGSTNGPRGNLRDTQGDTIVFDPTGINKPMHNWCVIFEIGV